MALSIVEVASSKDLDRFIKFAWSIYRDYPNWVPPLISQVKEILSPKRNPFFKHAEAKLYLAVDGDTVLGRIAAIHDRIFAEHFDGPCGIVGFFESVNDLEVSSSLFDAALSWLGGRGLKRVLGPINLSMNYECGLLVEGFEYPPCLMMPYNPPYYINLFKSFGFVKAKDLLAYLVELGEERLPDVRERVTKGRSVEVRPLDMKNFWRDVEVIRDIYASAWKGNWGFVSPTREEFRFLTRSLKDIADPDLTLILYVDGKPSGIVSLVPDVNQVLKRMNGRLFPFGIFKWLYYRRKIDLCRAIALGVTKEFQHTGLELFLFSEVLKRAASKGYTRWEVSWVLEDNAPVVNTISRRLGGKVYKRYRIFEKKV